MKYFLFVCIILLHLNGISQTQIPPSFKKAVAFIFAQNDSGAIMPDGTGFYVAVLKNDSTGKIYLATAKHVIKNSTGAFLKRIFLRMLKKKDSSLSIVPIDLYISGNKKNVFIHPDSTVDIAVISVSPSQNEYDYNVIPSSFITTREDFDNLKIMEGDEVFFTGMFSEFLGKNNNYPITRFGRVALVTNEKVFWNGYYRDLYLLEATTYWGNSGSPVYFALKRRPAPRPNSITIGDETVFKLAGIMSGFFGENVLGGLAETKNIRPYQLVNFGISAVTPSYLLWDILFSDEMRNKRGF